MTFGSDCQLPEPLVVAFARGDQARGDFSKLGEPLGVVLSKFFEPSEALVVALGEGDQAWRAAPHDGASCFRVR